MAILIEDHLPVVKHNGFNTAKSVAFSGAATLSGTNTFSGTNNLTGTTTITGDLGFTGTGNAVSFAGTGVSGGVLTNLYNTASSALSGTQMDIKVLIGTVPFYFTVYQTKA